MNKEILLLLSCGILRLIIGVEIVAKGVTLVFLSAGVYRQDIGFIQSLLVTFIIVETVLAAIMLALAVRAQKIYGSLDIRNLSKLRG